MSKLQGIYVFQQGKFNDGIKFFQIKQRYKSENKPSQYLVAILPDGSEAYISSLYVHDSIKWTTNQEFQFDFQGTFYLLILDLWYNSVEIKEIGNKKSVEAKKKAFGDAFGKSRRRPNQPFKDIFSQN